MPRDARLTPPASRIRSRGFSLVELMIVAAMTSFLFLMVSGMWLSFGRSLISTARQARAFGEADLALETLRRDVSGYLPGSAAGEIETGRFVGRLVTDGGTQLRFCFDGAPANGIADWAAPDNVVLYEIRDGQLVREDEQTGSLFVVTHDAGSFQAIEQTGGVRIELTVNNRDMPRTYTFIVHDP